MLLFLPWITDVILLSPIPVSTCCLGRVFSFVFVKLGEDEIPILQGHPYLPVVVRDGPLFVGSQNSQNGCNGSQNGPSSPISQKCPSYKK